MSEFKTRAKTLVIMGVIAVSFGSIIIKSSSAPSLIIASYRMLFTMIILTPFMIRDRESIKEIKGLTRRDLLLCGLSGFFLAMHFITWISSLKFTTINSSTILVNTHPIFIVIISYIFLRERFSRKSLLAIAITIVGSILISWGDISIDRVQFFGDILALLGGLFVSGYILVGNVARKRISAKAYCYVVYGFSVLFLFTSAIMAGNSLIGYSPVEYIRFLGLAFLCTILGHTVFNWALAYIKASFVSIAILGEPVFATIWAVFVFKEYPSMLQIIGSTLVFIGIVTYFKTQAQEDNQKDESSGN